MECTKKIILSAYSVKYVDLREPKPRNVYEEVYITDTDAKEALTLLGLELTDYIRTRYERGGYYCLSIERIKGGRQACIDLRECWEENAEGEA